MARSFHISSVSSGGDPIVLTNDSQWPGVLTAMSTTPSATFHVPLGGGAKLARRCITRPATEKRWTMSSWLAMTSWAATSRTCPPTRGRSWRAATMQIAARTPASSQSWRPGIDSGGPSSGPTAYIRPLMAWAVIGVARQLRSGPVAPKAVRKQVTTDGPHHASPSGSSTTPVTGVAAVGEAMTTSTFAASSASSGWARSSAKSSVARRHPAAYHASSHAARGPAADVDGGARSLQAQDVGAVAGQDPAAVRADRGGQVEDPYAPERQHSRGGTVRHSPPPAPAAGGRPRGAP